MSATKLLMVAVVVAILIVGGHDFVQIGNANRNIRNAAGNAASAAAQSVAKNHNASQARAAADAVAARAGDVITKFSYDPVAAKVSLSVGGSTTTWIVGRIDRSLAQDITASASARP
ncbi:MAG TPA: hypothetical protein VGI06_11905 [Acidimicrobiales bacterium]